MQHQAEHTSQIDSANGLQQGRRVGDEFYCENGDVIQADHNAALNVRARRRDPEITRFTPCGEVRRFLLAGFPGELTVKRHELQLQYACQPCTDKSSVQAYRNSLKWTAVKLWTNPGDATSRLHGWH